MTTFDRNVTPELLIWSGVVQGVGMGLTFVPLSSIAFITLSARFRNEASGIYSLARNIGSSIGISILLGSLAVYYRANREELVPHISPFADALRYPEFSYLTEMAQTQGYAVLDMLVDQEALMLAYVGDFRTMMWLTLAVIPLVGLLRSHATLST